MPEIAKGMNEAPKYVFSRTLDCSRLVEHYIAEKRSGHRDRPD